MKTTIRVTQEHIEKGNPLVGWNHPIALAMKGAGYADAHVGPSTAIVGVTEYSLPEVAVKFIHDLDWDYPVAPIEFEMDSPVPSR